MVVLVQEGNGKSLSREMKRSLKCNLKKGILWPNSQGQLRDPHNCGTENETGSLRS